MSSKVDERVVSMKFNNSQFERGVAETSKSLDALKKGLSFKDAGKDLEGLSAKAKGVNLQSLANGVEAVTSKLTALSVIGITALANLANKAVDAGLQFARSFTVQPIMDGFAEYELKMGSIQTILANTARHGTTLSDVSGVLDELNTYADRTIYNFADMTKNISLFTNAGIKVEDATTMIKGFSNAAAASGTSSQGAAGAAYQLSQALSAGTIRLMDWRSLTNVGMGNKNMQQGLIEIADAMGMLEESGITATEVQEDFNGSLEKNWLSAEVMSEYLKIMSNDNYDLAKAQALALGLTEEQADSLAKAAETAFEAATKVRTFSQLVGTIKEAVGSGWSQTFDILLGDFDQATELFTGANDAISGVVEGMSKARNDLLQAWADGGGRESLINTVATAWNNALAIIKPIKEAFQEIFPPLTADKLIEITKAVENFVKGLTPSTAALVDIKSTAKGFFALLDIGWMIIQAVADVFVRLWNAIMPTTSSILEMTGGLGDWIVKLRDGMKNGDGLANTFDWIGDAGEKLVEIVKKVVKWMGDNMPIKSWSDVWMGVGRAMLKVWEWLQPIFDWISEAFLKVKEAAKQAFRDMDMGVLTGLLNVGILGGIGVMIKKFVDGIPKMFEGMGGGIFDSIKGAFGSLTDTMEAMQTKLKAEALMKIAIAIGLLTLSVVALSMIDTAKLFIATGAMATMFAQLITAMVIMDKVVTSKGFSKMPSLAITMIGLAVAMLIFAAAIAVMASMEWSELAKGMTGMAVGLALMVGAMLMLDKIKAKMTTIGAAMLAVSISMLILAGALKIYATMSWEEIAKGVTVLAASLGALALASKFTKSFLRASVSILVISVALTVLGGALKIFATMSWEEIGKSMVVLAGSLLILNLALATMKSSVLGAASMMVVSVAIVTLSGALKIFSKMSWEEIGKSMVMLAGSLLILAGGMALMGVPLVMAGSIGIIAAGLALMMLAPALFLLGQMSWEGIGIGLTMLASAIGILALGGILLIPAIPGLLALGAATLLIGVGALAAGVGITLFASGLTALAAAAAIGSEAIAAALLTIIDLIPVAMAKFAEGIIEFAVVITEGGAEFTDAMVVLLTSLINAIIEVTPLILEALFGLLMQLVDLLVENIPILVEKGGELIIGVLEGMTEELPGIVKAGTDLILKFLDAMAENIPKLVDGGAKAVVKLINGIADAIRDNSAALGEAGANILSAIVEGMINGVGAFVGSLWDAASNLASNFIDGVLNTLGINSPSKVMHDIATWVPIGFANGVDSKVSVVARSANNMGRVAVTALKSSIKALDSELDSHMDLTPTITPVLDLSEMQRSLGDIPGMMKSPVLELDSSVSYVAQAQTAAKEAEEAANEAELEALLNSRGDVNFYQTNNSPKALSNAEIYRRTNNQLSVAKKELTISDA